MRSHSRHFFNSETSNELWQDYVNEVTLELGLHVICYLPDSMANSVADHWVLIVQGVHNQHHDRLNLLDLIDVLTHLGQGHDGSILVSPVAVAEEFLNEFGENWQQLFLSNGFNQSVDRGHTESRSLTIIILLDVIIEPFCRFHPFRSYCFRNLDHVVKEHFNKLGNVVLVGFEELG